MFRHLEFPKQFLLPSFVHVLSTWNIFLLLYNLTPLHNLRFLCATSPNHSTPISLVPVLCMAPLQKSFDWGIVQTEKKRKTKRRVVTYG